ncbi:MAG: AAA family ATPase [Saprospiraceae bacterium]|nr:AAA family ATPase [Saprospiraceae bacterium]
MNVFEQNYFQAKNAITELEENIRKIHREQQQLQNQIQNLKDEFTELKFKINGVGERLKIEFNIPVNDIINQEVDKEFDNQSLQEELEKLKIKISQYGDVNPLALEAYNEMSERFQKIQIQKQDIVSAKESLMETIAEIETTATRQFHEAFNQVRENFILVFRELFTEDDTCDLILENPSSPLESEIEIIAKPKGKKPKSISQLSGGEKTLTATALLFALYLLKPAPFCIFDEVDAPLDDANIQKFNRIIQKFSRQSQFIIVTHNKSTMVEVDTLYGVYMQAQGISEVSAVDFKKLKHESAEAIQ